MKKYILFLLLVFSIFTTKVYAYEAAPNNCIDAGTCMLVCNYENDFSGIMRSMSIYYYFDGRWEVDYWNQVENSYYGTKGPNNFGNVFSSSGTPNVYLLTGVNATNFKCPKHGYFDRNAFTEMCFSDTQEECEQKSGWTFTLFGSRDSDFKSDEKDYDFEEDILNYSGRIIKDIVEDITNGKVSSSEISDKVKKYFQTNYLKGNVAPAFIENLEAYQTIAEKAKEEYEKYKKQEERKAKNAVTAARQALKMAEEQYKNGEITAEEYEEFKNALVDAQKEYNTVQENWSATGEEVASGVENALKEMSYSGNIDFDTSGGCYSYLGNPAYDASLNVQAPAYYLQFVFNLIKYAAIVLLFVLSIVEFAKATASSNQDAMKKALQNTVKRVLIAVIIFLLPILIKFFFTIFGIYSDCNIS